MAKLEYHAGSPLVVAIASWNAYDLTSVPDFLLRSAVVNLCAVRTDPMSRFGRAAKDMVGSRSPSPTLDLADTSINDLISFHLRSLCHWFLLNALGVKLR
jgi:hypothetical protein